MTGDAMVDDKEDSPDIYPLRDPSTLTEKIIAPPDDSDIFAIKNEDTVRFGSIIGVTLGEGVTLCNAYRLDKHLSRNETGETWLASDLQASRNVVVYLPPLAMRTDTSAMEPVRQTARHVEALEHPHIVPLLENFTDPEHGFFVVWKFVNGKTLDVYRKDYIKQHQKLATTKAIKMLGDIAHALDYAHSVDVIHGDLCLKNTIVGLDDNVNVANFALSPVLTTQTAESQPYRAPEVIKDSAGNTYISSDVYALAVVAYELLSGRLPFSPETMEDVPSPIPGVSSAVDAVIRKAMARDPDDRYSSCGAFVKALETSCQESTKIRSVAVPTSSKQGTSIASRLLFWTALIVWTALSGLCLLVGAGIWIAGNDSSVAKNIRSLFLQDPPNGNEEKLLVAGHGNESQGKDIQDGGVQEASKSAQTPYVPKEQPRPNNFNNRQTNNNPSGRRGRSPIPQTAQKNVSPDLGDELDNTVLADKPTEPSENQQPPTEPEMPQEEDDDILPPLTQEKPPLPDVNVEIKEPDNLVSSGVPSLADALREEGEQMQLPIGGVVCRFRWCKGESPMMGATGFWIQETPVTQELWKTVMENMRDQPADGVRLPVVKVSWKECEQFIEQLNASDSLDDEEFKGCYFSLPTEAQWEYASRGNIFIPHEKVLEWCNDWSDDAKNCRVVCGIGKRNGRYPNEQGYDYVGFRLVIVRNK